LSLIESEKNQNNWKHSIKCSSRTYNRVSGVILSHFSAGIGGNKHQTHPGNEDEKNDMPD